MSEIESKNGPQIVNTHKAVDDLAYTKLVKL